MSVIVLRKPEDLLADEQIFPTQLLGAHKAIIGMSGSGKTVVAKRHVEQLLSKPNCRVAVLDPTGAWWGMRLMGDGVNPSPYSIIIMGGEHGDRELRPDMGGVLGRIVARSQISIIFDLSLMEQDDQRRFTADFLTAVHQDNRKPLHLIIDEADEFAPQRATALKSCRDALIRVMQRGRIRKIAITLITQRPAVIDKTALSQAKGTIIMGFTSVVDRKAVTDIVSGYPNKTKVLGLIDGLGGLQTGEGWLWCQPLGTLRLRQFPFIETYNSSSGFSFDDEFEAEERNLQLPSLNLAELDELLSSNTLPPEIEVESEEIRKLREAYAALQREIELRDAREEMMVRDGLACVDVTIDSDERRDLDELMLKTLLNSASQGAGVPITQLIASIETESRPVLQRSLLRLLFEGKVTSHDGHVWPTVNALRTADRTIEDFASSVNIDLNSLVISKPFLTDREHSLHAKLKTAAKRLGHHLIPQVAMAAFLEVAGGLSSEDTAKARRAFAGRHVDFAVCDNDRNVLAVVELDDQTHDAVTDAMRDSVAAAAGIPTVRLNHTRGLSIGILERMLRAALAGRPVDFDHAALRRIALAA